MKMNPLEMLKFVQGKTRDESEQLKLLASMGAAPDENYTPKIRLPVQNELPAFNLDNGKMGSILAGKNYGIAAPVIGEEPPASNDIGSLLVGDI